MALQLSLRLTVAAATCALAFSVSTAAHAAVRDQVPAVNGSEWAERPLALHSVLSLPGGPTGLLGAELDYAPIEQLGFTAGLGMSYLLTANSLTPRYALSARYRFLLDKSFAVGIGPTFSTGRWADQNFINEGTENDFLELQHAAWVGAQLSVEWRDGPLSIRAMSGVEVLTNVDAASCYKITPEAAHQPTSCANVTNPILPSNVFLTPLAFAIGYAF